MSHHHNDAWVLTHRLSVISNSVRNRTCLQTPGGEQDGNGVRAVAARVFANPDICRRMHMRAVHPPAEEHYDLAVLVSL